MDLIRKMILLIEESPGGFAPQVLHIEGYTAEQLYYHAYLMIQAGLATGNEVTHMGSTGPEAILTALTWEGHEFADAARDDTRWKKAMGIVAEKSGSVTLAVLTQLLTALMRSALGLP